MSNFKPFGEAIHRRFESMALTTNMFVTSIDPDELYEHYLAAFPEGTNPMFRERTEHDCSTCRNFIKHLGNVVIIKDGRTQTVWDVKAEYPYDVVAASMKLLIENSPIVGLFKSPEHQYGALTTTTQATGETYNHFCGVLTANQRHPNYAQLRGEYDVQAAMLKTAFDTFTEDALITVQELIASNNLYLGDQFKGAVNQFLQLFATYHNCEGMQQNNVVWANAYLPVARFKNTVIGTLVEALSKGTPIENAVAAYEAKTAPANYKRPTALITSRMIDAAVETIQELGLESALNRRFATTSDLSIQDILWVDNDNAHLLKNPITALLEPSAKKPTVSKAAATDISIGDFVERILPHATKLQVLFNPGKKANLVSITAPVDAESEKLFKWDNRFAWAYNGNFTDSITERVKREGGNVDAPLRASLAWYNRDDLDIHAYDPEGNHIYYGNKRAGTGLLDVDANGGDGMMDDPVENIAWTSLIDGVYKIAVNQYNKRSSSDVGFAIQIAVGGELHEAYYEHSLQGTLKVAEITIKDGALDNLKLMGVTTGASSEEVWSINTNTFVDVDLVTLSPNFWDGKSLGNKHWFFILKGCQADGQPRGIFNEFLRPELDKHRKVFEVLGDKTKCTHSPRQLSGLGFSSTKEAKVTVRVTTAKKVELFNVII